MCYRSFDVLFAAAIETSPSSAGCLTTAALPIPIFIVITGTTLNTG